jgi:CheY-like chemotaxis protein
MNPILLIADGDTPRRDLYRRLFTDRGYVVETATGGLQCLAQLRRLHPDVLVVNSDLPWGGGAGVLARMRQDSDLTATLVVVVGTTGIVPSDILSPPVVACLLKPYRLETLIQAVSAASANALTRDEQHATPRL